MIETTKTTMADNNNNGYDYNHIDGDNDGDDEFESSKSNLTLKSNYKQKIVWRNVIALSTLHLITIYSFYTSLSNPFLQWNHLIIADIFGRLSGLGILAGAHRLWAHRSYEASLSLRIFLMLLQTMALQNDIYDWCRDHRVHHKYSDTDADPYNVRRGFFFSHMGWLLVRKHPEVIRKGLFYLSTGKLIILLLLLFKIGKTIDLSDLWSDPVVRFQRRFYIPLVILFWGLIPTYISHLITDLPLWECFVCTVIVRYVVSLHCTWTVNSLAHMYGYQMFDQSIEPRENRLVTYLSLGEGYHNYHHVFPWDYSASELGWNRCFNLATLFIDFCAWLGLAKNLKKPDRKLIENRLKRTGNLDQYIQQQQKTKKIFSIFFEYLLGFIISEHFILTTFALRYLVIGKF